MKKVNILEMGPLFLILAFMSFFTFFVLLELWENYVYLEFGHRDPIERLTPVEELKVFSNLSKGNKISSKLNYYQNEAFKKNMSIFSYFEFNRETKLIEIYVIYWRDDFIDTENRFKIYEFEIRRIKEILNN